MDTTTLVFTPSKNGTSITDFTQNLLSALDNMFLSIAKLELNTGKARLLQSQ